jgi:hypothetical protein
MSDIKGRFFAAARPPRVCKRYGVIRQYRSRSTVDVPLSTEIMNWEW